MFLMGATHSYMTTKLLRNNKSIASISQWLQQYSDSGMGGSTRFELLNKFLKCATESNVCVLSYDKDRKQFCVSESTDKDFDDANTILMDLNFYSKRKYFDIIVRLYPENCSSAQIKEIVKNKQNKFDREKKDSGIDIAIYTVLYGLMKNPDNTEIEDEVVKSLNYNNKIPRYAISECSIKSKKQININAYMKRLISEFEKRRQN